jgi:hypothetical protein
MDPKLNRGTFELLAMAQYNHEINHKNITVQQNNSISMVVAKAVIPNHHLRQKR